MAVGDAIVGLVAVAAGANLDYQPAVGIEALLTQFSTIRMNVVGGMTVYDMDCRIWNGAIFALLANANTPYLWQNLKVLVNNTNYLRLNNTSGLGTNIGYSGVQIA